MAAKTLVVILILALGGAACSGGDNAAEGTTEPTTTAATATEPATTTGPATTTEPAVEPLTDEERAWARKVEKIRPRIDNRFNRNLTYTNITVRSLIRVLRTCKATLRDAGGSGRFGPAAQIARSACKRYETAAKNFETMLSVSFAGGGVLAGSPEEKIYNRAFDRALTAQSNGSHVMTRAEARIGQIRSEIAAESEG
jgi:hypothetical protein